MHFNAVVQIPHKMKTVDNTRSSDLIRGFNSSNYACLGAKGALCGPMGVLLADRSKSSKHRKCHLYLPRPIHACPRHGSWTTLLATKSCKVEGPRSRCSKMGIYQLRETTLTENIILPGLLEVGIAPTTQSVKKNNSYEI